MCWRLVGVGEGLLIDCYSTLSIGRSPSAHQLLPTMTYPLGRCLTPMGLQKGKLCNRRVPHLLHSNPK